MYVDTAFRLDLKILLNKSCWVMRNTLKVEFKMFIVEMKNKNQSYI